MARFATRPDSRPVPKYRRPDPPRDVVPPQRSGGMATNMSLDEARWAIRAALNYNVDIAMLRRAPWHVYETLLAMEMREEAQEVTKRHLQHSRSLR